MWVVWIYAIFAQCFRSGEGHILNGKVVQNFIVANILNATRTLK